MRPRCFLAQFSDRPCDGVLRRVHLIPKSTIARIFPKGAVRIDGGSCGSLWVPHAPPGGGHWTPLDDPPQMRELVEIQWDERAWRWACGGPMGNAGHHGMLDTARTLRIPRHAIPAETEEFAVEHGLGWWLDREYGERAA